MSRKSSIRSNAFFILWIASSPVWAQLESTTATLPEKGKVEAFHEQWSERVLKLIDGIDSFFGSDRVEEDAQQTRVKLRFDFEHDESDDFNVRARLSARISLPRTANRWSLVLNEQDQEEESDIVEEDENRSIAFRYEAKNSLLRNLSFDLGVGRPDDSYEPFVRARYRQTAPFAKWIGRLDNKLYAYTDSGLEYDGILDLDYVMPPTLLFRSKTRLRWWEDDDRCNGGLCPEQHFIVYQRMKSPSHALAYEINTFFESDPVDGSNDTLREGRMMLRYRHRTPLDWAFVEIRPALAFPRDYDYDPSWRLMIRLEGIFGYQPAYDTLEYGPERYIR